MGHVSLLSIVVSVVLWETENNQDMIPALRELIV